jgi:ABC-type multidrug transport system fused ATPase/permease subunit
MINMRKKLFLFYEDLIKVSKLTKTDNKKLKIVGLAAILNALVFFDIAIIVYFSSFFSSNAEYENYIIDFFLERKYFLPIFIILRFLSIYLEKVITTNLQIDIERNLRIYLVEEVFNRGNVSISDAYYYINTLCSQVGGFYSTLAAFFGSIIQILAFTTYLLFTNFETVFIFTLGSVLLFIPTLYLTKLGRKYAHISYTFGQKISKDIEKILDNLFLIKILQQVKKEITTFDTSLKKFYNSRLNDIKVGTISALMPNFFTLFLLSILLVFFNFVKYLTLDFIGILLRLFQSLGIFNRNIHTVSAFHVYLQKLYEIEKNKELIFSENYRLDNIDEKNSAIIFENVNFKYLGSEEMLFDNLNLEIPKGKHTIITGANGSGKSTILGLACGIFYPVSGKVNVYSNKLGYVSASPMIINGTLRENLEYGLFEKIEDNEMTALINEFKVFNDDIDHDLERSVSNKSLSMGQMQKISFIRALLSGVEILVLDESTSNLDTESKVLIYDILNSKELTILNSTHSPNELINYDLHIEIRLNNDSREIVVNS